MRKFLIIILFLFLGLSNSVLAAKIPDDVRNYINSNLPNTDFRFDGVIILSDNTVYLPLFPSLFTEVKSISVKETVPEKMSLKQKPNIVIFNNDFVLLKVITDSEGRKTVMHQKNPSLQVRTGLLPQDMLVPSGLILPENIKGIVGNLKIDIKSEDVIKSTQKESYEEFIDDPVVTNSTAIPQLNGKTIFATTNYSKNIQVLEPAKVEPAYSLQQKSVPISVKSVKDGKFLLVTSFERPYLDIISVADSRFIKQIKLDTNPEEILVDGDKAYVTSPIASTIYVVDLNNMTLIQKIRVNGYCEKLLLAGDKLFYVDKMRNTIWAIEMQNEYELKNIGTFPNVSSLAYINNKLYIASRTKGRIALVDYSTLGLVSEFATVRKPISMKIYGNSLYVLGGQDNIIQVLDVETGKVKDEISLGTGGFSTDISMIDNSSLAVVTDVKANKYSVIDLQQGKLIKTYAINVPINKIVVAKKIRLFN